MVEVKERTVKDKVYITGTIRAVKREFCYFEQAGKCTYIRQIHEPIKNGFKMRDLKEGDAVKSGDLLAQVDPELYKQDVAVAQAALMEAVESHLQAKSDYQRQKKLFEKNTISESGLEKFALQVKQKKASVTTAHAKLEKARLSLDKTKIKAPINGIIAYANARKGYYYGNQRVNNESEALQILPFVIIDDSEMEMIANIPSSYIEQVKTDQEVLLERRGKSSKQLIKAKVYAVNPAVDPGGRSIQVKVRLNQQNGEFKDGQYVAGWLTLAEDNSPSLPFSALLFENNKPYCFVVGEKDGKLTANRRSVKMGIMGGELVSIKSGVKVGEKVITDGRYRVVDNSLVKQAGN